MIISPGSRQLIKAIAFPAHRKGKEFGRNNTKQYKILQNKTNSGDAGNADIS
jgi:hypothetical protein